MEQTETRALADMKSLLYSQKEWVKIHVAEFLVWENQCMDEVRSAFMEEETQSGHVPKYRIGIWRVLAQAAANTQDRRYWVDKIVSAYQDSESEDKLHAIETLAKLKVPIVREVENKLEGSMRLYTLWNYALNTEETKQAIRSELITDLVSNRMTELEMKVSSYILRYIGPLSEDEFNRIFQWIQNNSVDSSVYSSVLATLWMVSPTDVAPDIRYTLKSELIAFRSQPGALNQIMMALAVCGDANDKEVIHELYDRVRDTSQPDYNSDLHTTAAYMMLRAEGVK